MMTLTQRGLRQTQTPICPLFERAKLSGFADRDILILINQGERSHYLEFSDTWEGELADNVQDWKKCKIFGHL